MSTLSFCNGRATLRGNALITLARGNLETTYELTRDLKGANFLTKPFRVAKPMATIKEVKR